MKNLNLALIYMFNKAENILKTYRTKLYFLLTVVSLLVDIGGFKAENGTRNTIGVYKTKINPNISLVSDNFHV